MKLYKHELNGAVLRINETKVIEENYYGYETPTGYVPKSVLGTLNFIPSYPVNYPIMYDTKENASLYLKLCLEHENQKLKELKSKRQEILVQKKNIYNIQNTSSQSCNPNLAQTVSLAKGEKTTTTRNLYSGKREDNNEWVEGSLLGVSTIIPKGQSFEIEGNCIYDCDLIAYEVIPETVREYTGLTAYWNEFENEPQEADVWEHDLLEIDYKNEKLVAVVRKEVGMFILCSTKFDDGYIPLFDITQREADEIYVNAKKIGNIHDNPFYE